MRKSPFVLSPSTALRTGLSKHEPLPAVQRPILNRFGEMRAFNAFVAREVGDGPRDFENAGIGPRAKAESGHGVFEEFLSRRLKLTELTNISTTHLRITKERASAKTPQLDFAGTIHARPNCRRVFTECLLTEFLIFDGRDFNLNINAVE